MSAPAGGRIVKGASIREHLVLEADACVVGSGAGGSVVARELAEAGLGVVVLEEGPHVPTSAFVNDEGRSLLRLYRDGGFRGSADASVMLLEGRCVGGSTVVAMGTALAAPDAVLDAWARESGVKDLGPAAMRAWFERVASEISVNIVPDDFINANNRALLRGAQALGWPAEPLPRNTKGCMGCGNCAQGCPTRGKRSALVTYIPKALRAGAAIYADVRVEALHARGGAIAGVSGQVLKTQSGLPRQPIEVRAPIVVLAAGAIETPALLLRNHMTGRSGQVGRNLRVQPSPSVIGFFPETIRGYQGIPQSVWTAPSFDALHAGRGPFALAGSFAGPATIGLCVPGFGAGHKHLLAKYDRLACVNVLLRDETTGEVREGRGTHPEIRYEPGDADRAALFEGMREAARLLFRAGADKVIAGPRSGVILESETDLDHLDLPGVRRMPLRMSAFYPQGTCRMGVDPARAVVGPTGEVHGIRGLFVADASIFPAPLGVPPQLTVMALATRTAGAIAADRRRYLGV
ncbi:MAG: hypothetical protein A2Y95_05575 [Deltaproteobacteria bacterium RBG_13_65_10]|nr:MAG: hypothetical protein A2Y95_05575 [Deltaproteobacteria bacterium RBG_13_65_10]